MGRVRTTPEKYGSEAGGTGSQWVMWDQGGSGGERAGLVWKGQDPAGRQG